MLGNFTLQPAAKGFVIAPGQPTQPGCWNEQGLPFYGDGVSSRVHPDKRDTFRMLARMRPADVRHQRRDPRIRPVAEFTRHLLDALAGFGGPTWPASTS